MKWYPWLNKLYCQILTSYQQARGHHALLLYSQDGNGEASLCYALSRWLICRQSNGIKSCGCCHNCRLMIAGNHPDFYQLDKGLQILGVDSIRAIIERLYNRSCQGGVKVVWLLNSEFLTEQATNALLKTLEEPPEDTYFLLGCQEPLRLLPTIKSRCIYWQLLSPAEELGIHWLQNTTTGKHNLANARTALRLCRGAPLAAEQLLQTPRWHQRLALCSALSEAITSGDMLSLLPVLLLKKNQDDNQQLHWLLTLISDALKWQHGAHAWLVNDDQTQLVTSLAMRCTARVLHAQWQQWLHCLWQWQKVSGINHELFMIHQLLNWEQGLVNSCALL